MFDRRLVEYFDWGFLLIVFVCLFIGTGILYSAVNTGNSATHNVLYLRQVMWYGIGLGVMTCAFIFNYKSLDRWGVPFYFFCVCLLVCVILFGKYVGGSRRWLVIGPFTIQPSELMKIAIIIVMARYYSKHMNSIGLTLRELIVPFLLLVPPFFLIVRQPDLGTAMLLLLITGSMTFFVRIDKKTLMTIVGISTVINICAWFFLLKGYQKQRIMTFLNPDRDPLGAGYHIIQSKIAIGSGMLTGKGYLKGTQKALSFLPEQHTDFILSVLAEEWGFAGCIFLLFVYLLLLIWGLNIAHECRDPFGTILAVGIVSMIFWQIFINVAMVMGLMPVVGVPLPLMSYGGSSVITIMMGVGLLLNISMRRFLMD